MRMNMDGESQATKLLHSSDLDDKLRKEFDPTTNYDYTARFDWDDFPFYDDEKKCTAYLENLNNLYPDYLFDVEETFDSTYLIVINKKLKAEYDAEPKPYTQEDIEKYLNIRSTLKFHVSDKNMTKQEYLDRRDSLKNLLNGIFDFDN